MTPDLFPTGPFRAAQWLTPVSFQYWFYYYLHQSVGERQIEARGAVKPSATASFQQHPPLLPRTFSNTGAFLSFLLYLCVCVCVCVPVCSCLIISEHSKHIAGRSGSTKRTDRVFSHPVPNGLTLFYPCCPLSSLTSRASDGSLRKKVFLLPRRKIRF